MTCTRRSNKRLTVGKPLTARSRIHGRLIRIQQLAPHRAYASEFGAGWHKGRLSEGSRYRRGHPAQAGDLAVSVPILELPGRAVQPPTCPAFIRAAAFGL